MRIQARSQVWIWGGTFPVKVDLFACYLGKSGIFLRIFWEKVYLFACFFGEGGRFCVFNACWGHVPWENFEKYD